MAQLARRKPKADAADTADLKTLQALIQRARSGDQTVLPELKKALDANAQIWKQVGDLHHHVEQVWLGVIGQRDLLVQESIRRQLRRLRRDLLKSCESVLEKHLVNQILATFLQTKHAELCLAAMEEGPLKQREHYARRVDQCNRRYATAIAQLLKARELLGAAQKGPRKAQNGSQTPQPVSRSRKAAKRVTSGSLRVVAE